MDTLLLGADEIGRAAEIIKKTMMVFFSICQKMKNAKTTGGTTSVF